MATMSKPDGAVRLSDLTVTAHELHPDYRIEQHEPVRGSTGYLPVFSLVPNNHQNPTFAARIDDGARNRRRTPELDIDIKGVNSEIERDFKACRNGYSGHHRDQSPNPTERVFEVNVFTPAGTIFRGQVSFKAHFVIVAETSAMPLTGGDARITITRRPIGE